MTTDQPTPRELECLKAYLAAGSVRGAAVQLDMAEQTMKNHLSMVRSKLRVKTTAQAVFALYEKLVA